MRTKRTTIALVAALAVASIGVAVQPRAGAATTSPTRTTVGIQGTHFLINGSLPSAGLPAEGQLLNSRMAQAIFDDDNPATVGDWAYPDTHTWDAQRNTNEFIAMLPAYAAHGIRMVTVGLSSVGPPPSFKISQLLATFMITGLRSITTLPPKIF